MQENAEIARKAIAAFNENDASFIDLIAPEFEYIPTGSIPGSEGAYRGPQGWKRFLELFWSEFEEAHIEIRDLLTSGDQVIAGQTFRGRGKQSGVEVNWDVWQVWTLRDGKVIRGQGFTSESEALEAAGLSE
jgi:ketosteroid isomerase-like protein